MIKTALIVGTYAALPYIHLHLESRKRLCPHLPMLVQDDASVDQNRLAELCAEYGVEFRSNEKRYNHVVGDMRVFLDGLQWANELNAEVLVKFSRRWVPLAPWLPAMHDLLIESDAPTLSAQCIHHKYGFRSECVAINLRCWADTDASAIIRQRVAEGQWQLVEAVIHQAAMKAFTKRSEKCRLYEQQVPHLPHCGGYIDWPWMKNSRNRARPDVLWHEWAQPHEYHRALLQWGIDRYQPEDFIAPTAQTHP
jgi:hypothetical protein